MNDKAPPMARQAGLARHLALDHNPLRRHIDRLETCITAGLLSAFLAGAPLVAVAVGSRAHAAGLSEQGGQRSWHQVPALLLQAAPRQAAFRHWSSLAACARASWTPPGGRAASGRSGCPPAAAPAAGCRCGPTAPGQWRAFLSARRDHGQSDRGRDPGPGLAVVSHRAGVHAPAGIGTAAADGSGFAEEISAQMHSGIAAFGSRLRSTEIA